MSGPLPDAADGPAPMSRRERVAYRLLRGFLALLARLVWRLEVTGLDRLPATGPFVVAPVHRSYVDFLVVGVSIPRVLHFMAKDSLWRWAWFGRFLERMGAFPVDRDGADRSALRSAEAWLARGEPVVMFPEGRRESGDTVDGVLDGPAWVACRNRVPIVPVGLGNTDAAMPIGARMIRPVKVRVVIGEPLYPDVPPTGRVPLRVISGVSDELRGEVQAVYDRARGETTRSRDRGA